MQSRKHFLQQALTNPLAVDTVGPLSVYLAFIGQRTVCGRTPPQGVECPDFASQLEERTDFDIEFLEIIACKPPVAAWIFLEMVQKPGYSPR